VFWKALVDAHLGRVADARPATELGIALARDANSEVHRVMNLSVAGFLEISVGNDAAALPYLRPLLDWTLKTGRALTNLPTPYALEALVGAGELDEAGELIARYRREARRLDSPWCLAIAARCRAQLAAAQGDLVSAIAAVEEALALHEEGDWPFERARALLVLGRTQRRLKQKSAAKRSLDEALAIFDRLPAPLWGERAREEIRRIGLRHVASTELTENERRVAELAASGLTNRQVAGRLFMSPKTVEANLARAYRKLGIHSRAELGARLGEAASGEVQT
jgi:DNA-binding CsgD family transcriptional regulator